MFATIINHIQVAAKAYVAVATPIIANAIAQLVTELNASVTALIAVVVGAIVVYLVPNKSPV